MGARGGVVNMYVMYRTCACVAVSCRVSHSVFPQASQREGRADRVDLYGDER